MRRNRYADLPREVSEQLDGVARHLPATPGWTAPLTRIRDTIPAISDHAARAPPSSSTASTAGSAEPSASAPASTASPVWGDRSAATVSSPPTPPHRPPSSAAATTAAASAPAAATDCPGRPGHRTSGSAQTPLRTDSRTPALRSRQRRTRRERARSWRHSARTRGGGSGCQSEHVATPGLQQIQPVGEAFEFHLLERREFVSDALTNL